MAIFAFLLGDATFGTWDYSKKSLDWAEAAAAGLRRATPTTPRTVSEEMAERGTKMRSVLEDRSGGVSWTPLSRRESRSLGTTPSRVSPSVYRRRIQRPSSLGRLKNALRSGSKSPLNSRTK